MNRVTCGIKSFLREEKLEGCLKSLVGKGFNSVIVADDGEISKNKRALYDKYTHSLPLELVELPFDTGISAGRNEIVKRCKTEYLLLLDDDQMIPDNITSLLTIMDHDDRLGGISGIWNEYGLLECSATDLEISRKCIIRKIRLPKEKLETKNISYYCYDFIPNSTLFRIECLLTQAWDPFYKIGSEHLDFYLAHKKLGRWLFAISPDVVIQHDPSEKTTSYKTTFRQNNERLKKSLEYLKHKWNIEHDLEVSRHIPTRKKNDVSSALTYRLFKFGLPFNLARRLANKVPYRILKSN